MLSCEGFVRRFVPADDIATLLHGDEVLFQLIHAINAWVYHMLTDLFLLYYQGMCAAGRYDVARRTTVAMLNAMEQHSHYDAIAYAMDADRRASGKKQ